MAEQNLPLNCYYFTLKDLELNKSNDLDTQIVQLMKKYLWNTTTELKSVLSSYSTSDNQFLLIVCDINQLHKSYSNQHWITFGILKTTDGYSVSINRSAQTSHDHLLLFVKETIEKSLSCGKGNVSLKFHYSNMCNDVPHISIALSYSKTIFNFFSGKINNQSLNCLCNVDSLIISEGLLLDFKTKPTLSKILNSIHNVLGENNNCLLPSDLIYRLVLKLENKNFYPIITDLKDLRKDIINIVSVLKLRGQNTDEKCLKILSKFVQTDGTSFKDKIIKLTQQLRDNCRQQKIIDNIIGTINERIQFLKDVFLINQNFVSVLDITSLLGVLFTKEGAEPLIDEKNKLESELNLLKGQTNFNYEEVFNKSKEIEKLKLEINYINVLLNISESIKFDEVVILLGNMLTCNTLISHKELDTIHEVLDIICNIGRKVNNENIAISIIKIFNSLPNLEKIDIFHDEILPNISNQNTGVVLSFICSKDLHTVHYPGFVVFTIEILLNDDDSSKRKQALQILQNYICERKKIKEKLDMSKLIKFLGYNVKNDNDFKEDVEQIVAIEEKCLNGQIVFDDCLKRVLAKRKLTRSCFLAMSDHFSKNEVHTVMKEIVEQEIQKLPNFFINNFKLYLTKCNLSSYDGLLDLCQCLMIAEYITLDDISSLNDLITSENNDDENDKGILTSLITKGQRVSNAVLQKIKSLPSTLKNREIILNETDKTNILILKNSKEPLDKRKTALKELTAVDIYAASILERIIRYDNHLKTEAFEVLASKLPKNFSKYGFVFNFRAIALALQQCVFHIDDISLLSKKDESVDFSDFTRLIISKIDPTNSENAITLLSKLISHKINDESYLIGVINFLIHKAYLINCSKTRQNIIKLLESDKSLNIHVSFKELDRLKLLSSVLLDENSNIKSCLHIIDQAVDDNNFITQDKIDMLIGCLKNEKLDEFHTDIGNTLFKINAKQDLISSKQTILDLVEENLGLLKIPAILEIIEEHIADRKTIISKTIKENVLQQFMTPIRDKLLEGTLLKLTERISQEEEISHDILHVIANIGANFKERMELRVYAVAILANQNQVPEQFIELLQVVCLKEKLNNPLKLYFIRTIFNVFKKVDQNKISNDFFEKFYPKVKGCLKETGKELDVFIKSVDKSQQLYVINSLILTLLTGNSLNTKMFSQIPKEEWLNEILTNALLMSSIQCSNMNNSVDEFELLNFIDNIKMLKKNLETHKNYSFPLILDELLDKQLAYKFNTQDTVDILQLLCCEKSFKIFCKTKSFSSDMLTLEELWLEKKLSEKQISYADIQLKKLNEYLIYRKNTIADFLFKINSCATMENLLDFFHKLKTINLNLVEKEHILKCIQGNTTIDEWNYTLAQRVAFLIVNEKLVGKKKFDELMAEKLMKKLALVLHSGWEMESVIEIMENVESVDTLKNLSYAIDPVYEYNLKISDLNLKGKSLLDVLLEPSNNNLVNTVHEIAIEQTFPRYSHIKSLEELCKEIFESNQNDEINILKENKLLQEYTKINKTYNQQSKILPNLSKICQWTKLDVTCWADTVKTNPQNVDIHEKIAVVKRGFELKNEYPLRDIQLLSLICLINTEKEKGRLAQINTGEGKTVIVAMLAVIKVLENNQVDIITSSPELAKPQAEDQKDFFSLFNISVSHNSLSDNKMAYLADVVYGSAQNFQGDILRDEFSKTGVMNNRKNDVAIVDEVDSMLIDGKNHIVMLSSQMPAMNHLETLLAAIWLQIDAVSSCLTEKDGKVWYVEHGDLLDEKGKLKTDVSDNAFPIEGTREDFIKTCTEKHLRKLIRDQKNLSNEKVPDNYPKLSIPTHLWELVTEFQLPKWIDSAIYAKYHCKNGMQYIIKEGKVAPVDAANTGIVQQNMHWSNGLHQFLQIKHGAKISPESLTTNFISNVTFFKRYKHKIFGLTGTLGSKNAKELLSRIYNVDTITIPPFKLKQHLQLFPLIMNNQSEWYDSIVESSISKLKNGRGVLVITKYIEEANILIKRFNQNYDSSKVKVYKTDADSHIVKEPLKVGEVIVATNIAGRGTDIKPTAQVEKNGGLHVCITFLPLNERVEQQNIGRTSRTGNKGTSQFILLENDKSNFLELKKIRDKNEEKSLKNAEEEIEVVVGKDDIFKLFCDLLSDFESKEYDKAIEIRSIEESFGFFLIMQNDNFKEMEKVKKKFETFKNQILKDESNGCLVQNPYFYILKGKKLIETSKYIESIYYLTKAIEIDKNSAENAYYNRAYARIAAYGKSMSEYKSHIEAAVDDLKKAREIIENRQIELNLIQKTSSDDILSEQVAHKMTLYATQLNTIEQAIGIDVENHNKQIQQLKNMIQSSEIDKEEKNKINAQIEQLESEKETKGNGGVINQAMDRGRDILIELLGIESSLPEDQDIALYKDELTEFYNNGFIGSFQITERKPIDWKAVISLAIIGLVQIAAGAAIAVYSLGAGTSIGMSLISEGISDIITAVKDGIINRNFDWKSWGIQKAISLTVSIVCAGWGAIKDAAKTAAAGMKMGSQVFTQTVKEGWKIAAKAVGTSLAKGVAKQFITDLAEYGIDKALIPAINNKIIEIVEGPLQELLLNNEKVKYLLQLDQKNKNKHYENLIKKKGEQIINPQIQSKAWVTILKGIGEGIAKNKLAKLQVNQSVSILANTLKALTELLPLVHNFITELNNVIDQIHKTAKSEEEKKEKKAQQKEKSNKGESDLPKEERVRSDIKFDGVIKLDTLSNYLTDKLSNKITSTIKGTIVSPLIHESVNFGISQLASQFDESIMAEIGNYQAERRLQFFQDNNQSRIGNEFRQSGNDPRAREKAENMVTELENGGKAGLLHLGPLSKETGRPIKVLDEKGRTKCIIGQEKGGEPIEVQYHSPNENNPSGHWTLPNSRESSFGNTQNRNDCLFNVVGEQTGRDPNQLREATANGLRNDLPNVCNMVPDVERLNMYRSNALMMGGAKSEGYTTKDLLNKSQGKPGHGKKAKSHPYGHVEDPNNKSTDKISDVKNYSEKATPEYPKTAFLNKGEQLTVVEKALDHPLSQNAMNLLNSGSLREKVQIPISDLKLSSDVMMTQWVQGKQFGQPKKATHITLQLQHHVGKLNDKDAPVQIFTSYLEDLTPES